jgi:phage-related protein
MHLESFSTKSGRRRYTAEAIDGIKNKIKSIWEAVVNAFKKLVNYVKDFFSKLFDANKKMLSRIIALRVKAKSIKGVVLAIVRWD